MKHIDAQPQLSRKKRFLFLIITHTIILISCVLLAETILRVAGFAPSRLHVFSIDRPGNYFTKHHTRGYAYVPGEFTVTIPGPYSYKVTHLHNGLRITHPSNDKAWENKKGIWIFGCSFTHGYGLNNEDTFPWLLQRALTDYEVVNFGVDGYGTVQSLIQFQESLQNGNKPAVVVVDYASFHDQRNGMSRAWKKVLITNFRFGPMNYPYAKLAPNNKLVLVNEPAPMDYPGLGLLQNSALAQQLDNFYNYLIEKSYRGHDVSKAVLEEFLNLCQANGIDFVVAGIIRGPADSDMLEYFNTKGALAVDISVDLDIKANTNLPYDGHPSPIATKQYAQKLESFLRSRLIDKHEGVK